MGALLAGARLGFVGALRQVVVRKLLAIRVCVSAGVVS